MSLAALEKKMNRAERSPRVVTFLSTVVMVIVAWQTMTGPRGGSPLSVALSAFAAIGMLYFVWTLRKSSQTIASLYSGVASADPEAAYHALPFDEFTQAMTFIANLSKHLAARRAAGASLPPDAELSMRHGAGGMILYFNEAAMAVFDENFPAPPPMRLVKGRDLPKQRFVLPTDTDHSLSLRETPKLPSA